MRMVRPNGSMPNGDIFLMDVARARGGDHFDKERRSRLTTISFSGSPKISPGDRPRPQSWKGTGGAPQGDRRFDPPSLLGWDFTPVRHELLACPSPADRRLPGWGQ